MSTSWREQRDKASRRLFYGLFFLLPLAAVFGHKLIAPWLLLASLPAFVRGDFWQTTFGILFDGPSLKRPEFAGLVALLAFCLWILISGVWSPVHHYGLFLWVLAPAIVSGSVVWFSLNLNRDWAWRLGRAFLLAIVGGMIVLSFEGITGGFLRGLLPPKEPQEARDIIALGRGVTALAPSLFPAAAIAVRLWSRPAAVGVILLGVIAAATNDVTANAAAIGFGLAAAFLALSAPAFMLKSMGWLAIALLLLTPFAAALIPVDAIYAFVIENLHSSNQLKIASWLHRLAIWHASALEALNGLPFGHGADYARAWKETAPRIGVPGSPVLLSVIPNHPHNVFIQVWLGLGLPGVAAMAAFFWCGLTALSRATLSKTVAAASIGAFAAILVSLSVEGSLWQVWRFAAMGLAAAGCALANSLEKR